MKKLISFFTMVLFLCICNYTYAQVNTYTFNQTSGSYTEITGGTVIATATATTGVGSIDDVLFAGQTIPFTFVFNGTGYTSYSLTSNGYLTFGAVLPPGGSPYTPISNAALFDGVISGIGRDLQGAFGTTGLRTSGSPVLTGVVNFSGVQVGRFITGTGIPGTAAVPTTTIVSFNIGAGTITMSANAISGTGTVTTVAINSGELRSETFGIAGSQVHVIQYKEFRRFGGANEQLNFQIRLYETTNQIQVVYGNNISLVAANLAPQVGLRGATNADFNNRTGTNWAASTAGGVNTSAMTLNNTSLPASGQTYTWSAPLPPIADDMGVSAGSVGAPGQLISVGKGYNLNATARNFGTATQNVVPVYYTVNGGSPVGPVNTVGPILSGGTENVVFSGGFAFTPVTAGVNVVKVYTALAGDGNALNDTLTLNVNVSNKITSLPYLETFTTAAGWTIFTTVPVGTVNPWVLASVVNPDGVAADLAAKSDFFAGSNSTGRVSILRSPEFDFTGIANPVLDFYVAYRTFTGLEPDRIQVLVSTDGGLTFNPASTPYNKTHLTDPSLATLIPASASYVPANQSEWRHETVDLSNVGNTSNVVIGFVATSAYGNNAYIDNVIISQPNSLCTDDVTGPGSYNCNALVTLDFTATPVPPSNNVFGLDNSVVKNGEKSDEVSSSSFIEYTGNGVINSSNVTDNPNGGTAFVAQYTNNNPGQTIAPNVGVTDATPPVGAAYDPTFVYHDYWFTVTYDGNDQSGYATYNISIDLDGLVFTDPSSLYVVKRTDRTGSWVCQNTTISGNTLTVTGLTDFSDFALAGSEALPVELSSFVSSISGNSVTLNWTTASEINNSRFDIERSSVSGTWSKVGNVTGNGTSATPNSYTFTERNVASGNYSYRLKQIDFNGNFEYFNLSNEVVIGIPSEFKLSQNYPNPFNPSTTISYEIPVDGAVSLKIFDMSGKEVMNLVDGVKNAGYYSINFNASNLSSGIYFYKLSANDFSSVKKMMLVK